MNMINFTEMKELPKEFSGMVCDNFKIMKNAAEIYKELKAEKMLEEIIGQLLPVVESDVLETEIRELQGGIEDYYASMDEDADEEWLFEHVNAKLTNLSNIERVKYLDGIVRAEMAAYPDMMIDEEDLQMLGQMREKEDCTDEDVKTIWTITEEALYDHAGVLARQSLAAMDKCLEKLDPTMIEKQVMDEKDGVVAYAAACYVAQKCGYFNRDSSNMDIAARLIGTEAAASLETSKLMKLYSTGKIKRIVLLDKIKNIFHKVLVFVVEHIVLALALAIQGTMIVNTFLFLLPLISELLYFSPLLMIITTAAASYFLGTKVLTTNDCVKMINGLICVVKAGWEAGKKLWDKVLGRNEISITEDASQIEEEDEEAKEDEEIREDEEDVIVLA